MRCWPAAHLERRQRARRAVGHDRADHPDTVGQRRRHDIKLKVHILQSKGGRRVGWCGCGVVATRDDAGTSAGRHRPHGLGVDGQHRRRAVLARRRWSVALALALILALAMAPLYPLLLARLLVGVPLEGLSNASAPFEDPGVR